MQYFTIPSHPTPCDPAPGRELGKVSPSAPLYIFGVTSVLAAVLVLLLPETKVGKDRHGAQPDYGDQTRLRPSYPRG